MSESVRLDSDLGGSDGEALFQPAAGVAARQRTKREVRVTRQRVASKPARHAKMERVAVAEPVRAERVAAKSAEHAKTGRVTAKPARDAKLGHRKGTGRTIGVEETHQKSKSKGA
jgi:hypothetical protein